MICFSVPGPSKPARGNLSTTFKQFDASLCLDNSVVTFCRSTEERFPFLVLEYDHRVRVEEVVITNTEGADAAKTRNLRVIVTDTYPSRQEKAIGTKINNQDLWFGIWYVIII